MGEITTRSLLAIGTHFHMPRGLTAGGAREYVSKLNNTQAIDRVEMIE